MTARIAASRSGDILSLLMVPAPPCMAIAMGESDSAVTFMGSAPAIRQTVMKQAVKFRMAVISVRASMLALECNAVNTRLNADEDSGGTGLSGLRKNKKMLKYQIEKLNLYLIDL
jgi:hypothetical protein